MNSRIYRGTLMHGRLSPVAHRFTYPMFTLALDLDELPELDRTLWGFGYNRFRPVSLHDRDYLQPGPQSIRQKLEPHLRRHGYTDPLGRVLLVTTARLMNYAFNPVSFYYVYREDGSIGCIVAEVNNTFGGRHVYVLPDPRPGEDGRARFTRPKAFHVSPFNDVRGDYLFRVEPLSDRLRIGIDLHRDGAPVLVTEWEGTAVPLNSRSLAGALARFPLSTFLTLPRILRQAAVLYYRKHLPAYKRPEPDSEDTLRPGKPARFDVSRLAPWWH